MYFIINYFQSLWNQSSTALRYSALNLHFRRVWFSFSPRRPWNRASTNKKCSFFIGVRLHLYVRGNPALPGCRHYCVVIVKRSNASQSLTKESWMRSLITKGAYPLLNYLFVSYHTIYDYHSRIINILRSSTHHHHHPLRNHTSFFNCYYYDYCYF